jgi:hypothetical protein
MPQIFAKDQKITVIEYGDNAESINIKPMMNDLKDNVFGAIKKALAA